MDYRLFFAILFTLVFMYFAMLLYGSKRSFKLSKTLSQNLSVNKTSFYAFMIGLLLISLVYLVFSFNFANDYLSSTWQFVIMSAIFSFLLVLIALFDENNAKYGIIHQVAAFGLAFIMPLILLNIILFADNNIAQQIILWAVVINMFLFATLYLLVIDLRRYIFIFQTTYFTMFFIGLIIASYKL